MSFFINVAVEEEVSIAEDAVVATEEARISKEDEEEEDFMQEEAEAALVLEANLMKTDSNQQHPSKREAAVAEESVISET